MGIFAASGRNSSASFRVILATLFIKIPLNTRQLAGGMKVVQSLDSKMFAK